MQQKHQQSTAVAKMVIIEDESGKISKTTSEIYDDAEAVLSLKLESIRSSGKIYMFKFPILFQIYAEGKGTIIENGQLDLYASGKSVSEAKSDLSEQFDHSYRRLNELDDEQHSLKLLQVKQYFNSIISSFLKASS